MKSDGGKRKGGGIIEAKGKERCNTGGRYDDRSERGIGKREEGLKWTEETWTEERWTVAR